MVVANEAGGDEARHGRSGHDELLNREVFHTLLEGKVRIERWLRAHNAVRRTARWAGDQRRRRRSSSVRSLRLRLSKRTGLVST